MDVLGLWPLFPPLFYLSASYLLLKAVGLWLHLNPSSSEILVKCLNHFFFTIAISSHVLFWNFYLWNCLLSQIVAPHLSKTKASHSYFVFYLKPSQMQNCLLFLNFYHTWGCLCNISYFFGSFNHFFLSLNTELIWKVVLRWTCHKYKILIPTTEVCIARNLALNIYFLG